MAKGRTKRTREARRNQNTGVYESKRGKLLCTYYYIWAYIKDSLNVQHFK